MRYAQLTNGGPTSGSLIGCFDENKTYLGMFIHNAPPFDYLNPYTYEEFQDPRTEYDYKPERNSVTFIKATWLNDKGDFCVFFNTGQIIPDDVWEGITYETPYLAIYHEYLQAA